MNNVKVCYEGISFASKLERDYYIYLKTQDIRDLQVQVPFILQEKFRLNGKMIREIKYIADFTYYDKEDKFHVIDTKGWLTDVFKLKAKLFAYRYKTEIEIIKRKDFK